jgi:hypothetical protein
LDALEFGRLNINDELIGCTAINALGKNNTFVISINPNTYGMFLDGGSLEDNATNKLINNKFSSKWNVHQENIGNLGAINFKNINSLQGIANDDFSISAYVKEVKLKDNNSLTSTGRIDLLTVDSFCANIDIQDGLVKEIRNLNGKNIYFLNGGRVNKIYCNNGSDYFYFSDGDVTDSIEVVLANAYFNFTNNAFINANIIGGSKINQLNYYVYNSKIDVDLNQNKATGIGGQIFNINSIIGDKKNFGIITLKNDSNICKLNGKYSGLINDQIYFSNISSILADDSDNIFEIHGSIDSLIGGNQNVYNFYSDGNILGSIQAGEVSNHFNLYAKAEIDGKIFGGNAQNILSYENYNAKITIDLNNMIATGIKGGFENIKTFIGDDLIFGEIISSLQESRWVINGNCSGKIDDTIYFSNIDTLSAIGNSLFHLEANGYIKTISTNVVKSIFYFNGGSANQIECKNGNNYFYLSNPLTSSLFLNEGINTLDYSINPQMNVTLAELDASDSFTSINLINGTNTCNINGNHLGVINEKINFKNISCINGLDSDNIFEINGSIDNLNGGKNNIYNFYSTGNIINEIQAGDISNQFNFFQAAQIDGKIIGRDAQNTISYQNYKQAVVIDLSNNNATGIKGGFENIYTFIGDDLNFGQIILPNEENECIIDGKFKGLINDEISFSNINNFTSGADTSFNLNANGLIGCVNNTDADNKYYFNGGDINKIISTDEGSNTLVFLTEDISKCNVSGGFNTLDYSNYPKEVVVDFSLNSASSYQQDLNSINNVVGAYPNFKTTIIGNDKQDTWVIDNAYQGSFQYENNLITFEKVDEIQGGLQTNYVYLKENGKIKNLISGSLANNVYLQGGDIEGQIVSCGQKDVYYLENNSTITGAICGGSNCQRVLDYSNYGSRIFVDMQNMKATGIAQTICCAKVIIADKDNFGLVYGNDTFSSYTISGKNNFRIDQATFENFDTIKSGGVDTTFYLLLGADIKSIEGDNTHCNTIDYSKYNAPISIDIKNSNGPGIRGSFANIDKIILKQD